MTDTKNPEVLQPQTTDPKSTETRLPQLTVGSYQLATQNQAIIYTYNEMLWQRIWVDAWRNGNLYKEMEQLADQRKDARDFLTAMSTLYGIPLFIPSHVKVHIHIDNATTKNIIMPDVGNMPASPIAMVPYAL